MTYGTLFQFNTRQADQCSARAIKRDPEFRRSCTTTRPGIWDVHATSVSIFASGSITATAGHNSGTENTFHRQVSAQSGCCTAATRKQSKDVFRRSSSDCGHRLSASGTTGWLSRDCQSEPSNWNIVLIAYSLRNCHKPINYWYQRNHDWLIDQ